MSIFKETFRKYVEKQFKIRQKLIAKGNSDKDSTSRLTGGDDLAPGAFYAYGQKQCVIRLASLVDLMEDIGLNLNNEDFKTYKGETFARNFILEGGISSVYSRNNPQQETRVLKTPRGGFFSSKQRVNVSYGDYTIASNPDSDGYGAVPMPGITDANIRTKSAYGSLREAKVNFVCHNLRQLEILELLYMRPGYPVLMEWGWSPYIKNDGSIENSFPMISDEDYFWDDKQVNQQDLQVKIINKKRTSNGNYDGFVGFVTNFKYTARADGGFNCSTELISMGEVLDSLKIPQVNFSSYTLEGKSDEEKEKLVYQSTLGNLIYDIVNFSQIIDIEKEIDAIYKKIDNLAGGGIVAGSAGSALAKYYDDIEKLKSQIISYSNITEPLEGLDGYFIEKNQVLIGQNNTNSTSTESFIRWDALASLINYYVIPTNEKGQKAFRIVNERFLNKDKNFELDPIEYTSYKDPDDNIMDVSCDPKVCILPHQFNQFDPSKVQVNLSTYLRYWYLGFISISWIIAAAAIGKSIGTAVAQRTYTPNFAQDFIINEETAKRRIGGIFINVNMLDELFKDTFSNNKNATLGDFLKKLWGKINEQCPMHNFGLRVDHEFTDIVQVIDLPITSKDIDDIDYDKLFSFNVQSNDTIVREFKYDTQIPNSLKATIAINAQAGATADDLDSVTFAAFNRSIKSRLHSLSKKFSENEEKAYKKLLKIKEDKEKLLQKARITINEYNKIFFDLFDANQEEEIIYGNIKNVIKEAQSLELYLERSANSYLKNQSIIPINLNLVLDGISGIVMGNVFKVDKSRLPKAYRKSNVAFVVLGEDQNITAGQDWTTNIRGQVILFPSKEKIKDRKPLTISQAANQQINQSTSAASKQTQTLQTGAGVGTINLFADQDFLNITVENVGGSSFSVTNSDTNPNTLVQKTSPEKYEITLQIPGLGNGSKVIKLTNSSGTTYKLDYPNSSGSPLQYDILLSNNTPIRDTEIFDVVISPNDTQKIIFSVNIPTTTTPGGQAVTNTGFVQLDII